jgi:hypothetical protein
MSRLSWFKNHTRRAHSISRAFVKTGRKGYTQKGTFGFFNTRPRVW